MRSVFYQFIIYLFRFLNKKYNITTLVVINAGIDVFININWEDWL